MNGIDIEEITVEAMLKQQFTPEFKEVNPMGKVPAIVGGRFELFENNLRTPVPFCQVNLTQNLWRFVLNSRLKPRIAVQATSKLLERMKA